MDSAKPELDLDGLPDTIQDWLTATYDYLQAEIPKYTDHQQRICPDTDWSCRKIWRQEEVVSETGSDIKEVYRLLKEKLNDTGECFKMYMLLMCCYCYINL